MHPPDPDGERTPGPLRRPWGLRNQATAPCDMLTLQMSKKPKPIRHGQSLVLRGNRKRPTSLGSHKHYNNWKRREQINIFTSVFDSDELNLASLKMNDSK